MSAYKIHSILSCLFLSYRFSVNNTITIISVSVKTNIYANRCPSLCYFNVVISPSNSPFSISVTLLGSAPKQYIQKSAVFRDFFHKAAGYRLKFLIVEFVFLIEFHFNHPFVSLARRRFIFVFLFFILLKSKSVT